MVEHDAISLSIRSKLSLLTSMATSGAAVDARAFVQLTDRPAPDICVATDPWQLARDPWFRDADLYLYEFGIQFDLFNAVFLTPPERPILGVFHNITPPELVSPGPARDKVHASHVQVHNFSRCAEVLCISAFNQRTLADLGVDDVPTSVVGLAPARAAAPRRDRHDGTIELIFIGRFVVSKGIVDLVHAAHHAVEEGATDLHVVLAGSPTFSDHALLDHVRAEIERLGLGERFEILLSPDDDVLATRLAEADALVVPSYHEGYCVPVVEAMASQCHVITYDAGSLPETVAGLGVLVPTGDVRALGDAIADYCDRRRQHRERRAMVVPTANGELPHPEWLRLVGDLALERSEARCEQRFLDALDRCLAIAGRPPLDRLDAAGA